MPPRILMPTMLDTSKCIFALGMNRTHSNSFPHYVCQCRWVSLSMAFERSLHSLGGTCIWNDHEIMTNVSNKKRKKTFRFGYYKWSAIKFHWHNIDGPQWWIRISLATLRISKDKYYFFCDFSLWYKVHLMFDKVTMFISIRDKCMCIIPKAL